MTRSTDISPLSLLLDRVDSLAEGAPDVQTIRSGFPSLDKSLGGGFRRGDLVVVGGDVGSGKSALALAIALRAAADVPVLFFTGEMLPDRVHERALAIEGRARLDDLRAGTLSDEARAAVGIAAIRLRDRMPMVERIPGGGTAAVGSIVAGTPEATLVVIDGLQGVATGVRPLAEDLAAAVRELKGLALDHDVAILATAQLPGLVDRADRRPALDDFGALNDVKHHADVVLGLYREELYDPARDIAGATELLVRKNRHGGTGYVDLFFYPQWLRFEDMLDPDR